MGDHLVGTTRGAKDEDDEDEYVDDDEDAEELAVEEKLKNQALAKKQFDSLWP